MIVALSEHEQKGKNKTKWEKKQKKHEHTYWYDDVLMSIYKHDYSGHLYTIRKERVKYYPSIQTKYKQIIEE